MLTLEERRALPTRRANRKNIDAFYVLAAAMHSLLQAQIDLEPHVKLVPGGWRDLRMMVSKMQNLLQCTVHTFEPDKQKSIGKQMDYLRIRTVFAPEAHRDPEMFMLPLEDLGLLIHAATQECKVRMCPAGDCARCKLGKALDRASFVTRGDRAWWEVFEQAKRHDVGMEV